MRGRLDGKRVAVLACHGVDRRELTGPREAREAVGAHVELIAPMKARSRPSSTWKGPARRPSIAASSTPTNDVRRAGAPGRGGQPGRLRLNHDAVGFVHDFVAAGKPVAAICHAPWLLIEAGVVRGRIVTSWPSLRTDLLNAGASWVDRAVCVDGALITSSRPADLPEFCAKLIELLADPTVERSSPAGDGADTSELDALVARGEESGCVQESEIDALAARLELSETGNRAGQADRARRSAGQGEADLEQPAAGGVNRQALPGEHAHDAA